MRSFALIKYLLLLLFSLPAFATDLVVRWETDQVVDEFVIYQQINGVDQPPVITAGDARMFTFADVQNGVHVFRASARADGYESALTNPVGEFVLKFTITVEAN